MMPSSFVKQCVKQSVKQAMDKNAMSISTIAKVIESTLANPNITRIARNAKWTGAGLHGGDQARINSIMSRVIGRRKAFEGAETFVPENMRAHMSGMTQGVPVEYERAVNQAARGDRLTTVKKELLSLVSKDVYGNMKVLPRSQWINTTQDTAGNAVMHLGAKGNKGIRLKLTTSSLGHTAFSDIEGVNPATYKAHGRQVGDLMRRRYMASSAVTPRLKTMQGAVMGKATPVMPMTLDSDNFDKIVSIIDDSTVLKYTIGPRFKELLALYAKPGIADSTRYNVLKEMSETASKVSGYPIQLTPSRNEKAQDVFKYFQHLKKTDKEWAAGTKILDNKVDLMNNLGVNAQAAINADPFWRSRQLYNYDLEMMGTRGAAGIVGLNKKDIDANKLSDVLMQHRYNPGFVGKTFGAYRTGGGKTGKPVEHYVDNPADIQNVAAGAGGNIVSKKVFGAGTEVKPEPLTKLMLRRLADADPNLKLKGYNTVLQEPLDVKGNKGLKHSLLDRVLYNKNELEQFNMTGRANEFRLNTNLGTPTGMAVPKLMSDEWRPGYGLYSKLSGNLTPHHEKLQRGVEKVIKNQPSMWGHQPYAYDLALSNKGRTVAYETNPVGWSVWDLAELQDDPLLALRHMSHNPYYGFGSYPEKLRKMVEGVKTYGPAAAVAGVGIGGGALAYNNYNKDVGGSQVLQ